MATSAAAHPHPAPRGGAAEGLFVWVATTDHKHIGVLYLVTAGAFFLIGGVEALLIRVQLAVPNNSLLDPAAYNAIFTMHGTTMIFLVVMPVLLGFANYTVPLMIGARDMAFPRLNAFSYWTLLFGGLLLNFSFLAGSPPDTGWFSNAPLTEQPYTSHAQVEYWVFGTLITSIGSIATGVNLVVTVFKLRAPGMTLGRMPVFVWMTLVTAFLILHAMPSLAAAQVMIIFDRRLGTHFFDAAAGATPLLWQHLFWYFGHPEVYIMALPAFGIISEVIPVFSRKPIFGYSFLVGSGIAIGLLSVGVWAHHMFTVGLGPVLDTAFGASSMLIAVPTGVKVFSWLGTMWGGRLRLTTAMLFAMSFVFTFTIGGITGVQFATVPVDWATHDTYYVVAHFHYVLVAGSFLAIMAAIYYWFPKMTGRLLDEAIGKWNFWLTFIGLNLTFFPMHLIGLLGQPRRTYTYPDLPGLAPLNLLSTIGAVLLAIAMLVLFWNLYRTLHRGRAAGNNPWDAWTLEWATSSPPPPENFAAPSPVSSPASGGPSLPPAVPPVLSARPLWEATHPGERWAPPGQQAGTAVARGGLTGLPAPVLGTAAFVFSELTFFGALIATFIAYRGGGLSGPGANSVDLPRTALFSIALFASSFTAWLAGRRLEQGSAAGCAGWLGATLALGLIFLFGQLTEYVHLYREGVTIDRNIFTSAFYTLTGFHGLHVAIGLIALAVLGMLLATGALRGNRGRIATESVSVYWHFVDAVWVVIFAVVYVWGALG